MVDQETPVAALFKTPIDQMEFLTDRIASLNGWRDSNLSTPSAPFVNFPASVVAVIGFSLVLSTVAAAVHCS